MQANRGIADSEVPAARSAVYSALLETRYADNAATTRISPFFFLVLLARKGFVAAKIRCVAARPYALTARAAAEAAAASPSSISVWNNACGGACQRRLSPLQQNLLVAVPASRSAYINSVAAKQTLTCSTSSFCLPKR